MKHSSSSITHYIEDYWQASLTPAGGATFGGKRNLVMHFGQIKLPNAIISPNDSYFAGTQFYWDTYFTILGLVDTKRLDLAKGMVDNLCYLYDKFGLVPARNSWTSIGRTQPPFLTRMAFEIYAHTGEEAWLDKVMAYTQREYETVWTSGHRLESTSGLSRYSPKYLRGRLAVFESGWDMSSRFQTGQPILPVDLNCLLYQYENDFLKWAKIKKDKIAQARWRSAKKNREELINKYFWDEKTGFFYDYNQKNGQHTGLKTLAGFYPLWCGAASKEQARQCLEQLKAFEQAGGLTTTEKISKTTKQWDYPNGWAPLQLIVIEGLINYEFNKDAKRLKEKWLLCNQKVFQKTGKLWEKYDVANYDVGRPGRYPTQSGFAWTNGVFIRLNKIKSTQ